MAIDPTMPAPIPAPVQQTPSPAAPDVQSDNGNQNQPIPDTGAQNPAPPKGTQPIADSNAAPGTVEPHHGILANIFQDLAGGKKTVWRQTDDGPVPVKENLAPGEMARGILAAALTGMAAGYGTRGGAGKAISAGFQQETQNEAQGQAQAQKQAQNEFQNQQTANDMVLRKQLAAREQMASVQAAQEHDLRMQQLKQNLEQGKTEGSEAVLEFQQKQVDRMNLLSQLGVKPLQYPNGQPVEEFNTPDEAMTWANKNASLAIQPGKYNTIVEVDPHTNRYIILQKPLGWDDPQWLGIKTENGKPIRDKNGDFIPDGSFKDATGKVIAPAGQMTPHQLYDSQQRLLETQAKELTLQESIERLKTAREARAKDEQQTRADDEWNRANGDADAVDPRTGQFIVSPSSRTILQQRFIKDGAMQASILTAAEKEMEKTDPKNQDGTNNPDYIALKQQADEARSNLHQIQTNMLLLSRTPSVANAVANQLVRDNLGADGALNVDAALKSLDGMNVNSGVKQTIRQELTGNVPSILDDPANFDKALQSAKTMLSQGSSLNSVTNQINSTLSFSRKDKARLLDAISPKAQQSQTQQPQVNNPRTSATVDPMQGMYR